MALIMVFTFAACNENDNSGSDVDDRSSDRNRDRDNDRNQDDDIDNDNQNNDDIQNNPRNDNAPPARNDENQPPPQSDPSNDNQVSTADIDTRGFEYTSLFEYMKSGIFSFDYLMVIEGIEMEGVLTQEFDRFAMSMRVEEFGEVATIRVVASDTSAFVVFEEYEMYMDIPLEEALDMSGGMAELLAWDHDHVDVPTDSGIGVINGKSLYYEVFEGGGDVPFVKYFYENGEVYAMQLYMDGQSFDMFISNVTDKVPAGIFDAPPAHYIDMMDAFGF